MFSSITMVSSTTKPTDSVIAIIEKGKLKGFNIAIGGGLSTTHGNPEHYARLATVIGFVDTKEKLLKVVYEVLTVQRDADVLLSKTINLLTPRRADRLEIQYVDTAGRCASRRSRRRRR